MCVIIVKPAGKRIPADLLEATASLNRDGWGLMGLRDNGDLVVERQSRVRPDDIGRALAGLDDATVALHLRLRTAGSTSEDDVHPFKVTDDLYLMHNGTLDIQRREPGRSDTWHLVNDVLRPLAERFEGLLGDEAFAALLEASLGPDNKLVLLDARQRRLHVINGQHGAQFEGLWLSTTRWVDRRLLSLDVPGQQMRSYTAGELQLI